MLTLLGNTRRFCNGVTRRDCLTAGALSVLGGGFNLPALLASEERQPIRAKAKNVILLYLHGGAPTQDMFDLKPNAPVEIRGEFKPIATKVPGIQICEHLPKMASWIDHCALVRSVHHKAGCHNTLPGFSGSEQAVDINDPNPKDSFPPGMGSVVEFLKPHGIEIPHYMAVPNYLGWGWALRRPGPWGGFLGRRFDPVCGEYKPLLDPKPGEGRRPMWLGAPFLADTNLRPEITLDRLKSRRSLVEQLDYQQQKLESQAAPDSYSRVSKRAYSLLTGSKMKSAFNLEQEDPKLWDRYGRHVVGSSTLIARRLIEAGVRFVDVYWDGYSYRAPNNNLDPYWDTHSNNFVQLKQANLPNLDQTYTTLLADLKERGLLEETLVVMMSDFGRTPRVNGAAGRDHWTDCYTVVFAGAGIKGGAVCGASDGQAAYVKDRPVRPADICSTIYHLMGISPETLIRDRSGQPRAISHGGGANPRDSRLIFSVLLLRKEPAVHGRVGVSPVPGIVPDIGVFRVLGGGASLFQGCDHVARAIRRHGSILAAMKCPNRNLGRLGRRLFIPAATHRRRRREALRPTADQVPGAIPAHRQPRDINALGINGIFFLHLIQ